MSEEGEGEGGGGGGGGKVRWKVEEAGGGERGGHTGKCRGILPVQRREGRLGFLLGSLHPPWPLEIDLGP